MCSRVIALQSTGAVHIIGSTLRTLGKVPEFIEGSQIRKYAHMVDRYKAVDEVPIARILDASERHADARTVDRLDRSGV